MDTPDDIWRQCVMNNMKGGAVNFRDAAFEFAGLMDSSTPASPEGWHAPGIGEVHNHDHTKMIYVCDGDAIVDDATAKQVCRALRLQEVVGHELIMVEQAILRNDGPLQALVDFRKAVKAAL